MISKLLDKPALNICPDDCSECCKMYDHVDITPQEYLDLKDVTSRAVHEDGLYRMYISGGCDLLKDNRCSIYDKHFRPKICAQYVCDKIHKFESTVSLRFLKLVGEAKLGEFVDKKGKRAIRKAVVSDKTDSERKLLALRNADDALVIPSDLFNEYLRKFIEYEDLDYIIYYPLFIASKKQVESKVMHKYTRDLGTYSIVRLTDRGMWKFETIKNVLEDQDDDPEIFKFDQFGR